MRPRHLFLAAAAFVLAITPIAAATTVSAADRVTTLRAHDALRITVLGNETFEANTLIQATFRFSPGTASVASGQRLRLIDGDTAEEPHTLTIVRRAQIPKTGDEVFNCAVCNDAIDAHSATDPPTLKVNAGASGIDEPGDSLLLLPDGTIGAKVTAPLGTKLSFLCAIHPWMQGRLVVV